MSSQPETPTSMTFRFSTRGTDFHYRSNQAVRLVLPGVRDPWGPARSFSLSSSPTETDLISVTAKMTGSPFKEALRTLRPGEGCDVIGPLGDLLFDPSRDALFIAGGIGVTPFRGMARYAADTGASRSRVLLYSARTPEEFAFRDELDAIARGDPHLAVHYTVTRPTESTRPWTGRTGRIDLHWVREALYGLTRPKVYVVGLPEMARDVLAFLRDPLGVVEDDLEYEYFMGY
ncbi:MAG TPA: FAD-dependent oxidoreductase [Thermoplasmata archaeon]|nr:FAD-dependent oxidoreductase [Thermoplasmata archaeon]